MKIAIRYFVLGITLTSLIVAAGRLHVAAVARVGNMVVTPGGVQFRIEESGDRMPVQDQSRLWWRWVHWTGDDTEYQNIAATVDRALATTRDPASYVATLAAAKLADPFDPKLVFAWGYARLKTKGPFWPAPTDADPLKDVATAIAATPFPPSARYARLAFIAQSSSYARPGMRSLVGRLLATFPDDDQLQLSCVWLLNLNTKPDDQFLSLRFLRSHCAKFPADIQGKLFELGFERSMHSADFDMSSTFAQDLLHQYQDLVPMARTAAQKREIMQEEGNVRAERGRLAQRPLAARRRGQAQHQEFVREGWQEAESQRKTVPPDYSPVIIDPCPGAAIAFSGSREWWWASPAWLEGR